MALQDLEQYEIDKEDGLINEKPGVVLLRHIYEVWPEGTTFLASSELILKLINQHPNVWGAEGPIGKELTAKRLGTMLAKGYRIHSIQPERGVARGYNRSAFTNPMHRMGVTPPPESDASDASDESDAEAGPYLYEPATSATSATEADPPPLFDTCQGEGCTAGLWHPESRQLGYCAKCRKNDAS